MLAARHSNRRFAADDLTELRGQKKTDLRTIKYSHSRIHLTTSAKSLL